MNCFARSFGEATRQWRDLDSVGGRRISCARSISDAYENHSKSKQREDHMKRLKRQSRHGMRIVVLYELLLGRQAERGVVKPQNAAIFIRRGVPRHAAKTEI